ncbi:MAG: MBL fold metallo-hydrolase, partial [Chlamydiia bacterium]|nr:MBL fold metallo-hydrolase [Chlamydiia bacterium]
GCDCPVCISNDPKDKRFRSAALLEFGGKNVLIDVGPDIRSQALSIGLKQLDGVLFTHAHQDHVGGIDDLRAFFIRRKEPLPVYLSYETLEDLKERFGYIFIPDRKALTLIPRLEVITFDADCGTFEILGMKARYFTYSQVGMKVQGFRFGDLGYVSDIKEHPESLYTELNGVHNLVVSALRFDENPIHFTVEEAIAFGRKVGAREVYLTHTAHELGYAETEAKLPENVHMAYDGLTLEFSDE